MKYYQKMRKICFNYLKKFFSFWGRVPRPPTGAPPLDPAEGIPHPQTPCGFAPDPKPPSVAFEQASVSVTSNRL